MFFRFVVVAALYVVFAALAMAFGLLSTDLIIPALGMSVIFGVIGAVLFSPHTPRRPAPPLSQAELDERMYWRRVDNQRLADASFNESLRLKGQGPRHVG